MKREPSNRRKVKKEIETLEGEKEIEREEETRERHKQKTGKGKRKPTIKGNKA